MHKRRPLLANLLIGRIAFDKSIDEVAFVTQGRTGADGFGEQFLQSGTIRNLVFAVFLSNQLKDIINIDFNLFDELNLKGQIIVDIHHIAFGMMAVFLIQVEVNGLVVLLCKIGNIVLFVFFKTVEGVEQINHPQIRAKEPDKLFLFFLSNQWHICRVGEELLERFCNLGKADMFLSVLVGIAVDIVVVRFKQHDITSVLIAKERDGIIGLLLQIAEANDVTKLLDGIEDTVRAAVGLHQSMLTQVLVHPEGVEGRCVKTGKEHIDHNQHIQFAILHPVG